MSTNPRRVLVRSARGATALGWNPVLAIASDGDRRVLQVVDWTGGMNVKPATGHYVGTGGLVADIADGADVRGLPGLARVAVRHITGPGDVQVSADDYLIDLGKSAPELTVVHAPLSPVDGHAWEVAVDGTADAYPVTLMTASGTFNGSPTYVIDVPWMALRLTWVASANRWRLG